MIREWGKGNSYTLEAAFITGSCISVAIKSVLFWALLHVYRNFGQGLRERSEYPKIHWGGWSLFCPREIARKITGKGRSPIRQCCSLRAV